MSVLHHL